MSWWLRHAEEMCVSDGVRCKAMLFPLLQGSCSLMLQTQASFCVRVLGERLEGAAEEPEPMHVQLFVSTNRRLG